MARKGSNPLAQIQCILVGRQTPQHPVSRDDDASFPFIAHLFRTPEETQPQIIRPEPLSLNCVSALERSF